MGKYSGRDVIPKNAKRVHRGVMFHVYQWRQRMYDGSYTTFERVRRPYVVKVIAVVGKDVLVTKEGQPRLNRIRTSLPGGYINFGENPLKAAKRELLEETGFASRDWALFKKVNPDDNADWTIFLFIARDCKKVAGQKLDPGEKIKVLKLGFEKFIGTSAIFSGYVFGDLKELKYDRVRLLGFKRRLFGRR